MFNNKKMTSPAKGIVRAVVFDGKDSVGIGTDIVLKGEFVDPVAHDYMDMSNYTDALVMVSTPVGTTAVVKCQAAKLKGAAPEGFIAKNIPDFSSAKGVGNEWGYMQMMDADSGSPVDGSVGVQLSGGDSGLFFVNVNQIDLLNFEVTSVSGGSVTLSVSLSTKNDK